MLTIYIYRHFNHDYINSILPSNGTAPLLHHHWDDHVLPAHVPGESYPPWLTTGSNEARFNQVPVVFMKYCKCTDI